MVKRKRLRDVLIEFLVVFILGLSIFYLALAVLIPDSPTLPRLAALIVSLGVAAGVDRLIITIYDRVRPAEEREPRPIGAGSEEAYLRGLLRDFEREQEFFVRLSGEAIPTRYDAFSGAYTHDRPGEPLEEYDDLRQAVRDHERFVIVGDPGAGKTTTMRRLAEAVVYARLNPAADSDPLVTGLYSREAWFPRSLWVKLGDSDSPYDALELLRYVWRRHNLSADPEAALANNDVWLFLDGLNEMPERGKGRKERAASIKALLEDNPNIRAIVTCRTWDYDELSLGLDVVRVRPLDWPRVKEFAYKRLGDQAEKFVNALEEAKPRLTGLADNPYYLVMLIEIFRPDVPIPVDLHELYRRYIEQCYARDEKLGLMRLPLKRLERRLRRLAFRMIARGKGTVAGTRWVRWRIGWNALSDGVNLGVLVRDEYGSVVRFYHESLHGYFALPGLTKALARRLLDRFRPNRRWNLIRRIATVGKLAGPAVPALIDALRDAQRDADARVCWIAAGALAAIGDAAAVPALIDALRDVDARVRQAAALALGRIGDAAAVSVLIDALRDADAGVRQAATLALGRIGDAAAVAVLIGALRDAGAGVRQAAAEALGRIGDVAAVPALIDTLRVADAGMRLVAASALGRIGDAAAMAALIDALRVANADVRWEVAEALGRIGDSRAVPALIERLTDTGNAFYGRVCDVAAEALERIGTPEALAAVEEWRKQRGEDSS